MNDLEMSAEDSTGAKSSTTKISPTLSQSEGDPKWWRRAKPFVEIAGVLLLAIYTCYTIKMYGANEKAADAAKESADAAHLSAEALRPSLAIAYLTPEPMTANGFPMDQGRLHVNFQIHNYGPVAAQNAQICEFDDVRVPTDIARLPYTNCQPSSVWTFGNPVIPPTEPNGAGQGGRGMNGTKNLTPGEINGLKEGTLRAVFSVLAIYSDAADRQHHAESCVIFTFQPRWGTGSADSQAIGTWSSKPCPWNPQND